MRITVTGAAGFIGSHLTEALVAAGHEVLALDCPRRALDPVAGAANRELLARLPGLTMVDADLATDDLRKAVDCEVLIHLAGRPGVRSSFGDGAATAFRDNVRATERLLAACAAAGTAPRLVFASSSSIYGPSDTRPHRETDPPAPQSPYARSKLAAERLLLESPAVILRYYSVYGSRQRSDMAFHRFIAAGLRGQPLPVFGDGAQRRSFTHVSDVVAATVLAATTELPAGTVLNIGTSDSIGIGEAIGVLRELMGLPLPHRSAGPAPGDVAGTWADNTAAGTVLGWHPRTGIREGLADQLAWQKGTHG